MHSNRFVRNNKVFHRLVNGMIIQLLSYRSFDKFSFTIQFEIYPLCIGGECPRCIDDDRLSDVFGIKEWEYGVLSCQQQMLDALKYLESHILPIFDSIIDYPSYLEKFPRIGCYSYGIIPYENEVYISDVILNKFDCLITSKEEYIKKWVDSNESYIQRNIAANRKRWGVDYHRIPKYQQEFEDKCNVYHQIKNAIEANNKEYAVNCIKQLEQQTMNSYILSFYGKKQFLSFIESGRLPFEIVEL
jgi:hypothetical protein